MRLGEMITQYRQEHDISQREFSRRCGLSNSLISIIEKGINPQTGKPMSQDLDTYHKIARAMGMTLQALFEALDGDELVSLRPIRSEEVDGHIVTTFANPSEEIQNRDRLEALHRNPRLGLLFDRATKMKPEDVEYMLRFADGILNERDGDA